MSELCRPIIKRGGLYLCLSHLPSQFLCTALLTTVSNDKAAREDTDVSIVTPGRHVDEVIRGVLQCKAEGESIKTDICNSEPEV